jgi:hypothetical protein
MAISVASEKTVQDDPETALVKPVGWKGRAVNILR